MRESVVLSLFLLVTALLLNGCGISNQGDAAAKELEIQTLTSTISPSTTTPKPATFMVSNLVIDPREVQTSDFFSISITVTNAGGSQGIYEAIVYIDEVHAEDPENVTTSTVKMLTKSVFIVAGESKSLTFDSISLQDGLYTVNVDNLTDYFEVGC